jgi:ubiquinone biosynthesis protein COQ9
MSFAADSMLDESPSPDWADAAEQRVLDAALALLGGSHRLWGAGLAREAAKVAGLSPAEADLLLPDGPGDLAALLSRRHDARALDKLLALGEMAPVKISDKIRTGVQVRIDVAMADEPAVHLAGLFLARPDHAALALSLAWESADRLWRWAGDTATDENHYSKRAILAGILTSTLAVRLAAGADRAEAYLSARIDNVMGFEKWKAKLSTPSEGLATVIGWLGRLRYGRRGDAASVSPAETAEGG